MASTAEARPNQETNEAGLGPAHTTEARDQQLEAKFGKSERIRKAAVGLLTNEQIAELGRRLGEVPKVKGEPAVSGALKRRRSSSVSTENSEGSPNVAMIVIDRDAEYETNPASRGLHPDAGYTGIPRVAGDDAALQRLRKRIEVGNAYRLAKYTAEREQLEAKEEMAKKTFFYHKVEIIRPASFPSLEISCMHLVDDTLANPKRIEDNVSINAGEMAGPGGVSPAACLLGFANPGLHDITFRDAYGPCNGCQLDGLDCAYFIRDEEGLGLVLARRKR